MTFDFLLSIGVASFALAGESLSISEKTVKN
jgi:hypothetical protein